MNPSRNSSLLPPGSSGSGDSCWGSESFPPTFSSSCSKNTIFKICFLMQLLPEKAAPHAPCCSAQQGTAEGCTGTALPNSPLHSHAQSCPPRPISRPVSWGVKSCLRLYATHMGCWVSTLQGKPTWGNTYSYSKQGSAERWWQLGASRGESQVPELKQRKERKVSTCRVTVSSTGFSLWPLFREFDMWRNRIIGPSNCWNILQSGTGQTWPEQHSDKWRSLFPLLIRFLAFTDIRIKHFKLIKRWLWTLFHHEQQAWLQAT